MMFIRKMCAFYVDEIDGKWTLPMQNVKNKFGNPNYNLYIYIVNKMNGIIYLFQMIKRGVTSSDPEGNPKKIFNIN